MTVHTYGGDGRDLQARTHEGFDSPRRTGVNQMFTWRIDGAISRTMRALTGGVLLDAGWNLTRHCAGGLGKVRARGDARVRWLELRNKIAAYRLFQGRDSMGRYIKPEAIRRLDPYSGLFAAEGYGYRNARIDALVQELPTGLSPIAIHAGAGLWLAERSLENIDAGRCESEALTEFRAVCRRDAREGFAGILEEALGFAARTLYPHLVKRLYAHLRTMSAELCARFWHGIGRGIYFAPGNILPFRAAPWKGIRMCLTEAEDETGMRNALSGFSFALTLINLRQPDVLEALFKHHARQASDCEDGVQSAMTVWSLCCEESDAAVQVAAGKYSRQPERLFSERMSR